MNIIVSNRSHEPIYEQISTQIKNMIMRGDLGEGDPLPSIRSLARELQISVITTKRAYDDLENEGYITSVPGKGTFVAEQNIELLKETRLRTVEQKLSEAIDVAKSIKLDPAELQEMLKILYEEG
ncbi:MAG TPA: GntR family transcriptional regulator [Spirochaetales bacterium]|nr:GntR family transcriptional regulator [Spirochaetales bacterium]